MYGFKYGWLLVLLTNFCKRVYGICDSVYNKNKLEYFLNYNLTPVLNTHKDTSAWDKFQKICHDFFHYLDQQKQGNQVRKEKICFSFNDVLFFLMLMILEN